MQSTDLIAVQQRDLELENKQLRDDVARLGQERDFYLELFGLAPVGYMTVSQPGVIADVNQMACTLLGRDRSSLVGQPISRLIHADDRNRYYTCHRQMIQSGLPSALDLRFSRSTETSLWLHLVINTMRDAQGERSLRLVFFDISERKKLELALQANAARLRTIIETEPECVKLVGPLGELLEMNGAGLQMLEASSVSEVAALGINHFILLEYRSAFRSLHARAMAGHGGLLEFEIQGLRGTRRWLESHTAPIRDNDGRITMVLAITRDITSRKQTEMQQRESEERIRMVFRTLSEGVTLNEVVCNEKGEMIDHRILEVNDAFYVLADYNSQLPVIGSLASELYGLKPEQIKWFWDIHKNATNTIRTEYYSEHRKRHFVISTSPIVNGRFVTTFTDVTDLKQAGLPSSDAP